MTMRFAYRTCLCVVLLMGCLYFAPAAYAGPADGIDLDTCAGTGFTPTEYTSKAVYCIKNRLITTTKTMLTELSDYMSPVVGLMFIYTVILFGIQMAAGERDISVKGISLLIKMALVWMFCKNLGGYSQQLFDIMDGLVNLASGGFSPWEKIDEFLGKLFGFGVGIALFQGLVGLIGAALFSGSFGFTMAMAGLMAIFNLLMFVFDVVFVYLSAVMLLCFMVIISPFTIPMALFKQTEKYFDKWLKIIASAILTPVMLFAFLSLTLGVFTEKVTDIFAVMGDPNAPEFTHAWQTNQPLGSRWQMSSDPQLFSGGVPGGPQPMTSVVANTADPSMRETMEMFTIFTSVINFGVQHAEIMQDLVIAFVTLWLYASIIKGMIDRIPDIAKDISGSSVGLSRGGHSFQEKLHEGIQNIKVGGGALGGAMLGDRVTGAITERSPVARQAGAIFGGVTGAMIGSRL